MQQGAMKPELKETITNLGLEYRLMTQFTSFVAVEEMIVTDGSQPRRIDVPVEVPEGVNRDALIGAGDPMSRPSATLQSPVTNLASFRLSAGALNPAARAQIVAKSGTSSAKSTSQRAAGGGGRGGSGVPNVPPAMAVTIADATEPLRIISPEEKHLAQLRARLHPSILAVIDRLKNKSATAAPDEAKFIRDGKAEVQIWLTDKSEETLAKLKELGFEVVLDPKSAKLIIGRLPIEKLEGLVELKTIRYVAPQVSTN